MNKAVIELGRLGGLKGGRTRAEKLSPEERSKIAKKGAEKRWGNKNSEVEVLKDIVEHTAGEQKRKERKINYEDMA